ncbi:MAG TPA: 23S rRNA (guanosine(2251)-2'-O)-methyltransferase RlmB [Candidatus Rifleibacterium sp.]|nr:23S rRNA (guanosine(2251)-2'-O)-methyltransferase RlmB [Candidatus Rifleibacterium sp.]HPW60304.1 23S rRNA (guanosine(2251)-2'-O)-methyltransferase RlmB [Candidatus Rifleibacterium sp.]
MNKKQGGFSKGSGREERGKKPKFSEDKRERKHDRDDKFVERGRPSLPSRDEEKRHGGEQRPVRPAKREDRPAKRDDRPAKREDRYEKRGERPAKRDDRPRRGDRPEKAFRKERPARKSEFEKREKSFVGEVQQTEGGEDERLILKGRHEVVQALESDQQIDSVVISTAVKGPVGSVVRDLASKKGIPVKEMNPDLFARKFGDKSQGIVAIGGSFAYCSLEEISAKACAGRGILVALNHVEDARNLGAIVRTVESSGCSGVLIPKHRSAGMTEWAIRTAQGAAAYLPVARVNNLGDALEKLKEDGFWVVGLDGDAPKRYDEVVYSGKIVLVAGGEDAGLGERVRKVCDDVVSIPLSGKTPSLNVSVSTAVALYEILRQKEFFKK